MVEEHMNNSNHQSLLVYLCLETIEHLKNLSQSIGMIKQVTIDIKSSMIDDESLVDELSKGLNKNKNLL